MKSLGYISLGMTFVNSLSMFVSTDQYARSVSAGIADITLIVFVFLFVVVLGAIYYFATSRAGEI